MGSVRDHPRSRGVYSPNTCCLPSTTGSSPLARGLLVRRVEAARQWGIIPARAGFTDVWVLAAPVEGDHPRSRGVYCARGGRGDGMEGSSPLARGLPRRPSTHARAHRIIPARAGFTTPRRGSWRGRPDHPRSRGVYPEARASWSATLGSSPLARGLLWSGVKAVWDGRIIPARAGFTSALPGPRGRCSDHPRSRGVYVIVKVTQDAGTGSSPLARGLRAGGRCSCRRRRIIPARAGFTDPVASSIPGLEDHPRSRGVYGRIWSTLSAPSGSSPLARGLRDAPLKAGARQRIIPARAGFTGCALKGGRSPTDHPRSRGVYGKTIATDARVDGSSPLARGLRSGRES